MITASQHDTNLLARLPKVRGRYIENVDLSGCSWFRVGGPADVVFRPADTQDLADFLAACPADIPRMVLGLGSNILVRDGGVRGVVIRLDRAFNGIEIVGEGVTAGAGVLDVNLARVCRDGRLVGFEFMRGIPGAVGGGSRPLRVPVTGVDLSFAEGVATLGFALPKGCYATSVLEELRKDHIGG